MRDRASPQQLGGPSPRARPAPSGVHGGSDPLGLDHSWSGEVSETWPPSARERIAELEQRVAQLQRSAVLKDDFVSMVSHELRGPLTAMRGATRTLLRHGDRLDARVARQLLDDVDSETERLARLLDNLLELSRAEVGASLERIRPTPLRPLLARLLYELRPRAEGRQLGLRAGRALPPAWVDPLQLEQVVRNLLDNAVKYSPPEARIVVSAAARAGRLEVGVRNSGQPIEPAELARLFDRFYRGHNVAGLRGGTGLGLTICRRLVEAQGGRIWAESDARRGVVFRFTVPCAEAAP